MEEFDIDVCINMLKNRFYKVEALEKKVDKLAALVEDMDRQKECANPEQEVTDAKKAAFNEAYLAIKEEQAAKEKEAFDRGVEYGKQIIKNKLDEIDARIMKKYASVCKDNELLRLIEEIL